MNELVSRRHLSKRVFGVIWLAIATLALITALVVWSSPTTVRAAWQYENGPITSKNIGDCVGAYTDYSSTVRYDHTQTPNVFYVDEIYYGGRKPDKFGTISSGKWRRESTVYRQWQDPNWVTVQSFGSSSWRFTGSACSTLDYWLLHDDVTLEEGALVKNKLRYSYHLVYPPANLEFNSLYHSHFLECQEC